MVNFILNNLVYLVSKAHAQVSVPGGGTLNLPKGEFQTIKALATGILGEIMLIGGSLAVVAFLYSGFMYLTAGDNASQAEKAKKNITWAIIGIVVFFLSHFIITTINQIILGDMSNL